MIIEALIDMLFALLNSFFEQLPDISWEVDNSFLDVFLDVLRMVCYLLPMDTVVSIIGLIVSITIFRIVISLIKTIWELIPLL